MKFNKLANLYLESIAGSSESSHNQPMNKKYYVNGQVNVPKVVKEIENIKAMSDRLFDGLDPVQDSELGNKISLLQVKLIDLSEDLKGNKKERETF